MSKKTKPMITFVQVITPTWAKAMLEEHNRRVASGKYRQRPYRKGAIKRYVQDMIAGRWALTHQGIAFDVDGNLADGQNRLKAVELSGKSVRMMITKNLPITDEGGNNPMDDIDTGIGRTVWQALQISHGYGGNALELASGARAISKLVLSSPARREKREIKSGMSTGQVLHILERLNYLPAFERAINLIPVKQIRPSQFMAPWAWLWMAEKKKAESFAYDYATLQNLGKGNPALALFRYVTTRAGRPRGKEFNLMSIVCNVLYAHYHGEAVGQMRGSDDAHLWLLKLNQSHVDKIVDLMVGEHSADGEPVTPEES